MSSDLTTVLAKPKTLDVLVNTPEGVMTERVTVGHIIMEDLPEIYPVIGPHLAKIKQFIKERKVTEGKAGMGDFDPLEFFLTNSMDCIRIIAVLQKKPLDWARKLEIDSAVTLFVELLMENLAFFIQRLLPCVSQAVVQLSVVKSALDQPRGPSSSKS